MVRFLFLILLACCCAASDHVAAPGRVQGHLTIISPGTVELADASPSKSDSKSYAVYALIVRSRDGKKEFARMVPDESGDYGATLPPGEYLLDLERERGALVRARPKKFSVTSNVSIRVDMIVDTGVR